MNQSDITFVKTRHPYDSYVDFWKLVELAGFQTIYVDEVDVSQYGVFITAPHNGEWDPHIDNQKDRRRNAHLVLWNLERPSGSAGAVGYYAKRGWEQIGGRYFDEIWVSDRRLADETKLRYVTLGSHKGLGELSDQKEFDIVHMSYEVPRRVQIYKSFSSIGQNCWPPKRHEVLKKSRFAVGVHQDNHPFQEPLRFALFASYGLPIITETIFDAYPYGTETMVFANYHELVHRIRKALTEDYTEYREIGLRCHKLMTDDFEFSKVVKQAIYDGVDKWR